MQAMYIHMDDLAATVLMKHFLYNYLGFVCSIGMCITLPAVPKHSLDM